MSFSQTPRHRSRGKLPLSRRGWSMTVGATLSAVACLATVLPTSSGASAATTAGRVQIGAIGDVGTLNSRTGTSLPVHKYGMLEGSVPVGRMVTVDTSANWSQVASAGRGSSIYNNLVRWANTLKARPGTTFLSFSHEPELNSKTYMGSTQDFINAFRRVVTVMRGQGATNVKYTWHMTGWSFRTSSSSRQYAAKWYPGDAYVDVVGPDEYNWYDCGEGQGRWLDLGTMLAPALSFARSHGKRVAIPEFGSHSDGRRAQWLNNAHQYLAANKDVVTAAFYFNRPPTNRNNSDCRFQLSTSGEFSAFSSMVHDTQAFTN